MDFMDLMDLMDPEVRAFFEILVAHVEILIFGIPIAG
jgi:hypothetical protein